MTIAIENASSELVDIFAEIHNLLSSHCCREKMDVVGRMNLIHKKSANNAIKEGPRPSANSREEWFCRQGVFSVCALMMEYTFHKRRNLNKLGAKEYIPP